MSYSIQDINQMSQDKFVETLGNVFEETPAIAHKAWEARPYHDVAHLHEHMMQVVYAMGQPGQIALIRAHPDLGSKAKMAEASVQEQAGAGLDRLTPQEFLLFQNLNQAYKEKFGFPFIVAVRNHTKDSILQAFQERLNHSVNSEIQQALSEIAHITRMRLDALINS
ncbi:2-oxo-4-hydroxy-4-carboxy-5-ureidoimidazoline decarboxylase [Leptolyngbya sp. AN02str]|uniref:2-oxo-4-hydroxy-4-carboxy-5-ureidoimidazoline decarboxylase n=1 Tax=Leptolyngbya sp. AN02str TaxID=3423363 RepID=UPI003D31B266